MARVLAESPSVRMSVQSEERAVPVHVWVCVCVYVVRQRERVVKGREELSGHYTRGASWCACLHTSYVYKYIYTHRPPQNKK